MEQGMNVRVLNEQEKCELISALANARVNNGKKAKNFKSAAQETGKTKGGVWGFIRRLWRRHPKEDAADLSATAERFDLWAQLDESLIEAIRENKIVIVDENAEV